MFTRKWAELGLTDDILRNLENELLENPKAGDVIQGTGGLRKMCEKPTPLGAGWIAQIMCM